MNKIKMKKTFLLIIPAILLFAGCAPWEKPEDQNENSNTNSQENIEVNLNEEVEVQAVNNEVLEDSEEPSEEDNSDWLTYESQQNGISFKYPNDYQVNDFIGSIYFPNSNNQIFWLNIRKGNFTSSEIDLIAYEEKRNKISEMIKTSDSASIILDEGTYSNDGRTYATIIIRVATGDEIAYYLLEKDGKTYVWRMNNLLENEFKEKYLNNLKIK